MALGDHEEALAHYQISMNINRSINKVDLVSVNLQFGNYYSAIGNLDSADYFFNVALQASKQEDDARHELIILANIGSVCEQKENWTCAKDYYQKAIFLRDSIRKEGIISGVHQKLGDVLLMLGDYENAETQYLRALEKASLLGEVDWKPQVYLGLSRLQEELKNSGEALRYYKLYTLHKDSIQKVNDLLSINAIKQQLNQNPSDEGGEYEDIVPGESSNDEEGNYNFAIFSVLGLVILVLSFLLIKKKV
jgi:tetratricopeptide (TPR) repeat protein